MPIEQLQAQIKAAAATGQRLCITGSGSKQWYGGLLQGERVDMRALSGISSYEPTELVVTARAGMRLSELDAQLAKHGQYLAFDAPRFGGDPTVGGIIASGLSGPARATVGSVRDFILGMTVINGKGEVLSFGGQVMKNVAGFDVSRLMCGSLGTLGVILEASIKVLPLPPAQATLVFDMDEAAAIERINRWAAQALPINASCWVRDQGKSQLFVRLRGAVAAVESACKTMGGAHVDDAVATADWARCRDHTLPFFSHIIESGRPLWRLSVPGTTPPLNLGDTLIEWHGAQRWLTHDNLEAVRAAAARVGGHATLFRNANDVMRAAGVFAPLAAPLDRIHRDIKSAFDPQGVFNRGRLSPDF
jgi:glycolate oxidase FAD binding subunit